MAAPAIGSLSGFNASGRLGVVVGARPIGEPEEGRQLFALRVKTIDGRDAQGTGPSGDRPVVDAGRGGGQRATGPKPAHAAREAERVDRAPAAARTPDRLTPAEKAVVDRLRQRDAQVRQEEKAHAGAAGDIGGPISYVYQRGPDGRSYAVGGSVPIRAQSVTGDPAETRRLGAKLAAAAMVATNPSAADYAAARKGYALAGARAAGDGPAAVGTGQRIDVNA